jgi:hypothetical protein
MLSGKFFLAVLLIAIAITTIQWFFVGFLFHKHQASTPATWRKESSRSYAASTVLSFFFAFLFTMVVSLWLKTHDPMSTVDGIEFGAICWLTFSIPIEIGSAIYVNTSRMFVFGKCLSSLVEYCAAGVVAVAIL